MYNTSDSETITVSIRPVFVETCLHRAFSLTVFSVFLSPLWPVT